MKSLQGLPLACVAIFAPSFCQASEALAQTGSISQADIDFFQQESYRSSNKSESKKDWEDFLFEASEAGKTPGHTVALFAARINADQAAAETIASAILALAHAR